MKKSSDIKTTSVPAKKLTTGEVAEEDETSLEETVETGVVEPDWEKRQILSKAYDKILDALLRSDILEHKGFLAKEKAKQLSVNDSFQRAVETVREKWGFETSSCRLIRPFSILQHPEVTLFERIIGSELDLNEWRVVLDIVREDNWQEILDILDNEKISEVVTILKSDRWRRLKNDLRLILCQPFELDWPQDYGLLVAALCYGLTPDNLVNCWGLIESMASKTQSAGADFKMDRREREKEILINAGITAYLVYLITKHGIKIALPSPICDVVTKYMRVFDEIIGKKTAFEKLVNHLHDSTAPFTKEANELAKIIENINSKEFSPDLYLKLEPHTRLSDIRRMWPLVERTQLELWGELKPPVIREWRTYERDVYIWKRVRIEGMTYEAAYNQWLTEHPEDKPVEISAIIKAVTKIDKM